LNILTFFDAAEVKFCSLKVWNWIVQSYKIKPKLRHVINPPLSNLANHILSRVNLLMTFKDGQSLVKASQIKRG